MTTLSAPTERWGAPRREPLTMKSPDTVGFIGLGLQGTPIARRLVNAGHPVTVWNRTPAKTEPLLAEGAHEATSPAEVMEASDVVILCVTDAAAVEEVTFGPAGLASTATPGKLVVDHSSIRPQTARDLANRLATESGASWVDAPVSGGVAGATAGTLTIMAGGAQTDFDRADTLFAAYARRRTLIGPVGSGQTVKLCNQIIVATTSWGLAEATQVAAAAGLDPARLPEYLEGGLADSPLLRAYQPHMVAGHDTSLASIENLIKDLDSALDLARKTNCPVPLVAQVTELLRTAVKWTPPAEAGRFIDLLKGPQAQ
nr:NAD(P)-dependent oxidoreductase [Streptomyces regalis]